MIVQVVSDDRKTVLAEVPVNSPSEVFDVTDVILDLMGA